jgi:putative drug exporter of the RND superfamily
VSSARAPPASGFRFASISGTLLLATGALVFVLLILIYRSPIFWVIPLFTC